MEKRLKIENETFEEERALYHVKDADVAFCRFEGAKDGESAMKEGRNLNVRSCHFALRYPLWHVEGLSMKDCEMTDTCRAALWYDDRVKLFDCRLGGIKALRECRRVVLAGCEVRSPEFGWKSADVTVRDSSIESEYAFWKENASRRSIWNFRGNIPFSTSSGDELKTAACIPKTLSGIRKTSPSPILSSRGNISAGMRKISPLSAAISKARSHFAIVKI